jgi:transcription antitermination factor NusG
MDLVIDILIRGQEFFKSKKKEGIWDVSTAYCLPEKFPGVIFFEANSVKNLNYSISGMDGLRSSTLSKIEFSAYATLFGLAEINVKGFQVGQYVRIKKGKYEGDLGLIRKINRNGVVLEVVPRIDFSGLVSKTEDP